MPQVEGREERLYRRAEAVHLLTISNATFQRLVNRGELTLVRLGPRTVRVSQSSILALLERSKAPRP